MLDTHKAALLSYSGNNKKAAHEAAAKLAIAVIKGQQLPSSNSATPVATLAARSPLSALTNKLEAMRFPNQVRKLPWAPNTSIRPHPARSAVSFPVLWQLLLKLRTPTAAAALTSNVNHSSIPAAHSRQV
jgi:hypothetical protein